MKNPRNSYRDRSDKLDTAMPKEIPKLVPAEHIEERVLLIRGKKVMLDVDLAELYGVSTKRLNEQVRRNRERFPGDFMFQLTADEKDKVVANCDHLSRLRFSSFLPYAFTEHGAVMLASIINSPVAVEVSVQVVRAFIRLRKILDSNMELSRRLDELERKFDSQFRVVFEAIRQLMAPPPEPPPRRKIGFTVREKSEKYSYKRKR